MANHETVVVIDWTDASGQEGPVAIAELSPLKHLRSYGVLIHEDKKVISLAQDYCDQEHTYREVLHIPKINITRIQRLKVKHAFGHC